MQGPAWKGERVAAKPLVLGVPSPSVSLGFPALAVTPLTCCILFIQWTCIQHFLATDTREAKERHTVTAHPAQDLSNMVRDCRWLPPTLSG